jgi:hypothetical protein
LLARNQKTLVLKYKNKRLLTAPETLEKTIGWEKEYSLAADRPTGISMGLKIRIWIGQNK